MFRTLKNCRFCLRNRRSFSNKKVELDENEPVKFTTSPAGQRIIRPVMRKTNNSMPWYQPYSVLASVTAFLIYFCVLREESDVDLEFDKTLYDRIQGLEKHQLIQAYKYNKEHGKSVEEIEKRLVELDLQEKASLS